MSLPRGAVVAPTLQLAAALRQSIASDADLAVSSTDNAHGHSVRWSIDTRYYTADVELQVLDTESTPTVAEQGQLHYEAVVLAYQAGQETSLEAVTHWFAIHGAAHGVSGAEVRLCVATQLQGEAGSPEGDTLDSAALEWCIEHGFEHVPLPCQHDGDGDASSLREAQGVARLREALQAHTWPGLVAKPRGGIASVGDQVAGKSLSVAAAVEALEREASVDKGDDEHDRFESLMANMQRARSAATCGDVPDDVRRATAAVLAMQMARMLGVDDEGESSDGENVDDGQEHHEDGYQPLEEPGE